ncbi:hypothetical protein [Larkinella arboricola]
MFDYKQSDEQRFIFKKGDGVASLNKREFIQIFADAFDNMLYNFVESDIDTFERNLYNKFSESTGKVYYSNSSYWKETLLDYNYIGQTITLKDFAVIEWLPSSPGLFFTGKAEKARRKAELFVNPNYNEYLPLGKLEMIMGGVGSVRLGSEGTSNSNKYFMCATSNGASHEGIPLILDKRIYLQIIDEIKTKGYCKGTITGTIAVLHTEKSIITFDREIPKYCLLVEHFRHTYEKKDAIVEKISVTIAAAFQSEDLKGYNLTEETNKNNFAWTYCTFDPCKDNGRDLKKAVEWITQYTYRYSSNPRIISDFDEHFDHFGGVDFTLQEIMSNRFNKELLKQYEYSYQININKLVFGDNFEHVSGMIINRSIVTNSLNKVSQQLNDEAVQLLKGITEAVEKSGNNDATENLEEFYKELQNSKPKKSLLKSFWYGVVTAVPMLIIHTDRVMNIIEKA